MTFFEAYTSVGEVTKYSLRRVNALTDSVIVAKGAITDISVRAQHAGDSARAVWPRLYK